MKRSRGAHVVAAVAAVADCAAPVADSKGAGSAPELAALRRRAGASRLAKRSQSRNTSWIRIRSKNRMFCRNQMPKWSAAVIGGTKRRAARREQHGRIEHFGGDRSHRQHAEQRRRQVEQPQGDAPVELHRVERVLQQDAPEVRRHERSGATVSDLAHAGGEVGQSDRGPTGIAGPAVASGGKAGIGNGLLLAQPAPAIERERVGAGRHRQHEQRVQRHQAGVVEPGVLPQDAAQGEVSDRRERQHRARAPAQHAQEEKDRCGALEHGEAGAVPLEGTPAGDAMEQVHDPHRPEHLGGEVGRRRQVFPQRAGEQDRADHDADRGERPGRCEPDLTLDEGLRRQRCREQQERNDGDDRAGRRDPHPEQERVLPGATGAERGAGDAVGEQGDAEPECDRDERSEQASAAQARKS